MRIILVTIALLLVAAAVLAGALGSSPKLGGKTGPLARYVLLAPVAMFGYFVFAAGDAMLLTFLPIYAAGLRIPGASRVVRLRSPVPCPHFSVAANNEREVRLGHRSAGIEDAPQNGRGEREVESDHPLDQAQVGLGGEVVGQLLTQRCRHGFGLVIRETCVF